MHAIAVATDGPTLRALVTCRLLAVADARAVLFLEPTPDGHRRELRGLRPTRHRRSPSGPTAHSRPGCVSPKLHCSFLDAPVFRRTSPTTSARSSPPLALASACPSPPIGRLRAVVLVASTELRGRLHWS